MLKVAWYQLMMTIWEVFEVFTLAEELIPLKRKSQDGFTDEQSSKILKDHENTDNENDGSNVPMSDNQEIAEDL
jgi:hypothetical protein